MRTLLFATLLFITSLSMGQTSSNDGDWRSGTNWENGTYPPTTVTFDSVVRIHGVITRDTLLRIDTLATLHIGGDGDADIDSLILSGNLIVYGTIIIHTDGVLIVAGERDLWNKTTGDITVEGILTVNDNGSNSGNILVKEGATFNINGQFENESIYGVLIVNGTLYAADFFTNMQIVKVGPNGYMGAGSWINNNNKFYNDAGGMVKYAGYWGGNAPIGDPLFERTLKVSKSEALPVELTFFTAHNTSAGIIVTWQTASEKNNDYFTLEYSTNGLNYKVISEIKGAGYSQNTLNYRYIDSCPFTGMVYYRLTQTDFNGDVEVFPPISILSTDNDDKNIKVGPIPATDELKINIPDINNVCVIELYNISGNDTGNDMVKRVETTDNQTTINVSDLSSGYYMIIMTVNNSKIKRKVIIK